ncbi:MAG: peptide-methionine (R)-S-oxide reductase MsrB [Sphingomonas sp.]|nr:peptide-methionine (R)-S-oxide reductase MsrB [Sphingomonas sp.]RZV49659.1 MAG: peptide-methionine (R)-S-oxide reductase [Sphingomonadaceae bacterium]
MTKQKLTDAEWRARLTSEEYRILREAGTEPPYSGALNVEKRDGEYHCAGCGAMLFASGSKYDSGSGWPSFTDPAENEAITEHRDESHGMTRVEIRCSACDGHLGHVFPDGPGPSGLRYCVNSASLDFQPDEK